MDRILVLKKMIMVKFSRMVGPSPFDLIDRCHSVITVSHWMEWFQRFTIVQWPSPLSKIIILDGDCFTFCPRKK
jgi:hypothetical protein